MPSNDTDTFRVGVLLEWDGGEACRHYVVETQAGNRRAAVDQVETLLCAVLPLGGFRWRLLDEGEVAS